MLRVLLGRQAIARASAPLPDWPMTGDDRFTAILSGREGITIVAPEELIPPGCAACESGWVALELVGPFPFSETGVLASILGPLAEAGIAILAYSSFDTDIILVKEGQLPAALDALTGVGHRIKPAAR